LTVELLELVVESTFGDIDVVEEFRRDEGAARIGLHCRNVSHDVSSPTDLTVESSSRSGVLAGCRWRYELVSAWRRGIL
jgi:hypothetical protein